MSTIVAKALKGISPIAVVIAAMVAWTPSAMAADWPNSRGDAGNTGRSSESLVLPLTERWHSSAPLVEENGAVISNGIAYMSSNDGQLYAFDVATGAVVPGFPVTTASNYGTPAVDAVNGKVYVLASSFLYAYNLDGTSAWTASVGGGGLNLNVGPVVEDGFVYLKAGSALQKYDSAGTLQWSVPSVGNNTQPAIMGGFVYTNTEAGEIRKYNKATGVEVTTGGFPISTDNSGAGLSVVNGRIFHHGDQTHAYNASTGALAWSKASGGTSFCYNLPNCNVSPAVSNGVVYVYGWDSKLYAFDEATGTPKAGFPSVDLATPSDRNFSSPTVAGDLVFIAAGTSQKLKVLGAAGSASAGMVLAEYPTFSDDPQGFDLISPVVSDGVVFAILDGGGLYAFFDSKYPRPGSATPLRVPLVVAYDECTAPNARHVVPKLSSAPGTGDPSCAPPARSSGQLTTSSLGKQNAFAKYRNVVGIPSTPEDETDIIVTATVTDVRNQSGGTDYVGPVILRSRMRITDRGNDPGGVSAATVSDFDFDIAFDCSGTSQPDLGSSCNLETATDALVPNFANEGNRALIAVLSVKLLDAGPNPDIAPSTDPIGLGCPPTCGSGDEEVYLDQGVVAP